jgi:2-polyprenyl-3-methyl-5-hydroxy-6-metoxy-1,4-benzoquinol methylase
MYDFITASEVVEHLHHPRFELERLWSALRPRGILGIMTKRVRDQHAFANWHYKNDPTHVIFFSEATFVWLSRYWSAELQVVGPDVVLFRKQQSRL